MKLHRPAAAALAMLLAGATASAATVTTCTKDRSGKVTCRKASKPPAKGNVDHRAGPTLRNPAAGPGPAVDVDQNAHARQSNSDGTVTRRQTDQHGNTTFRNRNTGTVRCSTDSTGKTTCRPH